MNENTKPYKNGVGPAGKSMIGPDVLVPATSTICSGINEAVQIRKSDDFSTPYISVTTSLRQMADKYEDLPALASKVDDKWTMMSYRMFYKNIRTVAKAFLKLGLEKYHSVGILGINSAEWLLSAYGAIVAGAIQAGIYTTNSPEACLHCLKKSYAQIVVVQNGMQLEKILKIRHEVPDLKVIVQIEGTPTKPGVISWKELIEIGENETEEALQNAIHNTAINECCCMLFTSGTTGPAKGVMLHHDNFVFTAGALNATVKFREKCERMLTYLPLSHIAEMIIVYLCLQIGGTVYFADPNVMKGTLVENLRSVRPTLFFGVPRVWEKLKEGIEAKMKSAPLIKKWLLTGTSSVMIHKYKQITTGYSVPMVNKLPTLFQYLVCNKVKESLGLSECRMNYLSGAAPLMLDVKHFFAGLDMPISEAYGMSESTGPMTVSQPPVDCLVRSCGQPMPHLQVKIKKSDSEAEGEICTFGRHVFMGYVDDLEKTKETLDEDGWLRSGDVGKLDPVHGLIITGRLKDIIITAGGENIPTGLIEETIKSELPVISQAILIGDARKYLTVLITLKSAINKDTGAPLDELDSVTKNWCQSLGSQCGTVSEIIQKKPKEIYQAIEDCIERANKKAISNAQRVQKFRILPKDFSIITGELGPTMKVKRKVVLDRYKDVIEDMYKDN